MTTCQYFLQGRCKFGRNCRNEHIIEGDNRNSRNLVYSQHLNSVIKQIEDDVIAAEKGGQWPLSCFSPVRGGPNIPGWEDVSPEEVRWKMYEARANGTLDQCNHEINQLYSNAEKMRNLVKEPTLERVVLIINFLKGKKEGVDLSAQLTNTPSSSASASPSTSNIFGNAAQSSGSQNIFGGSSQTGSHGNIFGGAPSTTGNIFGGSSQTTGNIFGNANRFSNQNIFGGSTPSNTFSQNSFSTPQTTNNIFSNSSLIASGNVSNTFSSSNSSGIFSNQTPNASQAPIFGSNTTFFQSTENQAQNQSIFGNNPKGNIFNTSNIFSGSTEPNKNVFGIESQNNPFSSNNQTSKQFDSSVYSKLEDLTEEEIKSFTSPTFTFGKIPLKPPLKEYCK